MKLPALCLLAFGTAFALLGIGQPDGSAPSTVSASKPLDISGPSAVTVRDLAAGAAGSATQQDVPQPPAPPYHGPLGPAPATNVTDASVAGLWPLPPIQAKGFEGLSNTDNMNATSLDLSQPDPQLAVGQEKVVELTNVLGRVFNRSGGTLQTFTINDFFDITPGHFAFNSRIIYDDPSGRFFAVSASYFNRPGSPDEGGLHLAVSQTGDPSGAWSVYHTNYVDIFPDQPALGLTDDKVTVSSAMYDIEAVVEGEPPAGLCAAYCGEQTIVFQKTDLLSGVAASELDRHAFPLQPDRFAMRPAHSLSSTSDQYLVTVSTENHSRLHVIRVSGTPDQGNVVEAELTELTILTQNDPPPSITAGSGNCVSFATNHGPPPCIYSNDYRLLEAVWRDNRLWMGASAKCRPTGDTQDRSCAHLIQVETEGTPSKLQDIMFGAAGEYYSYPSLRIAPDGDIIVAVAHTNPSVFAELRIIGQESDDNPNAMDGSLLVRTGEVVVTSGRWGDYFGAAVDPLYPHCIWIAGAFPKATLGRDWSTYLASASYGDGCPAATPVPTATNTPTRTPTLPATLTPTRTPTPPPLRGDVNCDRAVSSVDAAVVLQFSAGLLGGLDCQENADVNHDGAIDSIDVALILQFSAGLLSSLPA
jgi:hypothetical protein